MRGAGPICVRNNWIPGQAECNIAKIGQCLPASNEHPTIQVPVMNATKIARAAVVRSCTVFVKGYICQIEREDCFDLRGHKDGTRSGGW